MKNVIVYKEEGRYAGWPANYGIWSWGNEIVVGFITGYPNPESGFHARDKSKPFTTMQARSLDGGENWKVAKIPAKTPGNKALSADEHMEPHLWIANDLDGADAPIPLEEKVDFTHPDFALMCARTNVSKGTKAWFYTSIDRCQSWQGPFRLSMFGQLGVAARTDYIVLGRDECLLFLTAPMETEVGSRVFCAKTKDGGKNFDFVSWITPKLNDGWNNMPASVRISESHILVATRKREHQSDGQKANWIDLYSSNDNGKTWVYTNRPVPDTGNGGNPPTLTKLNDGRICMTYGYRKPPFSIRAKISDDNGTTWGDEIILRCDAGSHDIGYPRTVQRVDGTMVTVYYYNDQYGGPCYIAATLWKP